jgi:hypothetical protein
MTALFNFVCQDSKAWSLYVPTAIKLSVIRQKRIPSHRPLEGHNSWLENDGPNLGVVGGWGFEIGAGSPGEGSGPDFIARKRLFVNQTKLWLTVEIEPF